MRRSTAGFTIVELLIVIVVIAILAAISVVAYTGMQTRAENTKTISGVSQYVKLLSAYKAINGDYPTHAGASYACLGTGYTANVCQTYSDGTTPAGVNNAAFNTALESIGSLPQLSTKNMTLSAGHVAAGASFQHSTRYVRYHLLGSSHPCEAGGTLGNYGSVTQCIIVMP